MSIIRLIIFTALATNISAAMAGAKSTCVVRAQDPVIQTFFRSHGFDVDYEKGDFQVEFEVTCEAIDKQKEAFSSTEVHQTTTKLEIFNEYENQRVIYHSETETKRGGRVVSAFVVPCLDNKAAKQRIIERSLKSLEHVSCDEE